MYIQLMRLKDDGASTVGTMHVNGEFECFTLEDTYNESKVYGKTRIPAGEYPIGFRDEGGMTQKYAAKYGNHQGMLWLAGVPGFEYVYIHVGNDEEDTDGCILVGMSCDSFAGTIGNSRMAYKNLYAKALSAINAGEDITIQII